jgi:hypothetical protein
LVPLSENPDVHPKKKKKNEPLSQEMLLKILCLSVGLKLPSHKLGRREAALYLFLKQISPTDFSHQVDSDSCNFHLIVPALTLVSFLER